MKILIYTPNFLPKIGGLENVAAMLAHEFHQLGEDIKVATYTRDDENATVVPYEVCRNPTTTELLKLVKWCDIFFQHNVSLKGIWPLFIYKRKFVVAHHTANYKINGSITFAGKLKQLTSKYALNICCSSYIAGLLPSTTVVIPNCYDTDTFVNLNKDRPHELVFVGRLVSDKGCDLIIKALAVLKNENLLPRFTIVGLGPEEENLKQLANKYHLQKQVIFTGAKKGAELVEVINQHQVMIVPSVWQEPFGIVALEGLACGCKIVVANVGGLPEAIGNHGVLFEKENTNDLAEKIKTMLYNTPVQADGALTYFLAKHSPIEVAKSYLSAIKSHFQLIKQ